MPSRILIVGGVAGGATAAARAKRLDDAAEVTVFERGPYVSFANCGLPYHIGGEIERRTNLILQTPEGLKARFGLDVRTRHEVLAINRAAKSIRVRNLDTGGEFDEHYDFLLLSPGAAPIRPRLPGIDHPRILTLRNLTDMDAIKAAIDGGAKSALVVGGGFIGLELAENFRRRGLDVTLVELLPQVMPPIDAEMATPVHETLRRHGVRLMLGKAVAAFGDVGGRVRATLEGGGTVEADLVALSVGVRPDTKLAKDAGLRLSERGAIVVDEHMRTSDPAIYAVGDAVQVRDAVVDAPTFVPLAGPASRQARVAADNIFGRRSTFRGVQGTSICRVFDLTVASTGLGEKTLNARGLAYRKAYVLPMHHVGYFPGAEPMTIKVLFSPDEGRVLGAQIVGGEGVDKRIDVLATAIQARMTVEDLEQVELAYAPQFGAAKDPVNLAGFVATNVLRGDDDVAYAEDIGADPASKLTVVDVRSEPEFAADRIAGALLIPLPELRQRWREIPTDKPVLVHCAAGQRGYYAARFLRQHGIPCRNLSGGLKVYRYVHPKA
jgi:NADPH-dependent 2,4-dienoyl-CoA reductase/sulfur reductase-like enzyme/rhodanese-related sulfurtransferase